MNSDGGGGRVAPWSPLVARGASTAASIGAVDQLQLVAPELHRVGDGAPELGGQPEEALAEHAIERVIQGRAQGLDR